MFEEKNSTAADANLSQKTSVPSLYQNTCSHLLHSTGTEPHGVRHLNLGKVFCTRTQVATELN